MQTISAEDFQKKYGQAGVAAFSAPTQKPTDKGYVSNVASAIGNDLSSRFADIGNRANVNSTDISKGQQPTLGNQVATGVNIAKNVFGATANAIEQPILQAPGVKQAATAIGEGMNWLTTSDLSPIKHLGDIIGSNKTLQAATHLYDTNPSFKDTVDALGNAVRLGADVSAIYNSANFTANVTNKIIQTAKSEVSPLIDAAKAKVASSVESTPADIMNRVARIKPTDATKFEKLSGKTVGQYLTDTGNFGAPDKILTTEAQKFAASIQSVDTELAKLPGVYKTGAITDALKGLAEKAKAISSENVQAPLMNEVRSLVAKYNADGLSMADINTVKRLYEREVKLGYKGVGAQVNPEAVARATNIDSALRNWQVSKAAELGFTNIADINKQTQLSKFVLNKLGDQVVTQSLLNGINLTDWIVLSGGTPSSVAGLVAKKLLSSKSVQARIAKLLNQKDVKGLITPEISITPENISRSISPQGLKALPVGGSGAKVQGNVPIPLRGPYTSEKAARASSKTTINPKTGDVYVRDLKTGKVKFIPSTRAKPRTPQTAAKPSVNTTTSKPISKNVVPKATVSPELAPLAKEAQKYKTTLNIQNKEDLAYLGRIFSEDTIAKIKNGEMTNWRGENYQDLARVNIVSYTPQTMAQELAGRIKPYELDSNTVFHGTSPESAVSIKSDGFKVGSSLKEDAFRGGGYDARQNSISFSTDPMMASNFTGTGSKGSLITTSIKPSAKIVTIKGIDYAEDLNKYVKELRKQGIDAVYLEGEKEVAVINKAVIDKITDIKNFDVINKKSQLTDFYNKITGKTK